MGRKKRPRIRCIVPGCSELIQRRAYCIRHYRERVMPKCSVKGCQRHASHFGRCEPHWKNGGRALRPRPQRRASNGPRVFGWSRLYLRPEAVPVVEEEARRLGLSNTGILAEIVEAWARARVNRAPPRIVTVCRGPDCERPAGVSGLCRTHQLQEQRGQPLRPIRPRQQEVRMGSLRLPGTVAKRLRARARTSGVAFNEALRQALAAGLEDTSRLARLGPVRRERGDNAPGRVRVAGGIG